MIDSDKFKRTLDFTLTNEGDYSDHPDDGGGKTFCGITELVAKRHGFDNVRALTLSQIRKIYHDDYWAPVHGDDLPGMLGLFVFDQAVNCGVKESSKRLQNAINQSGIKSLRVDGIIGPKTLEVATMLNTRFLTIEFIKRTYLHYASIVSRRPDQTVFIRGWINRVNKYLEFLL